MRALGRAFFFSMMLFQKSLLALTFSASVAAAQDIDLTPLVSSVGLADTIVALKNDPPGAGRDFALGGVLFLHGIEKTLQQRYRHNADFGNLGLPVLRLPLPRNPDAAPFYPALVTDLFRDLGTDMQGARAVLTGVEGGFGVTLDLTRVWFDINENGARDTGEGLLSAAGAAFGRAGPAGDLNSLVVRFDTADAAWLTAYTHLLEAFTNAVLAFDPTKVIADITHSIDAMDDLRGTQPNTRHSHLRGFEGWIDTFAIAYGALNQQPDPLHTRALRENLLAMVAQNRRFWDLLALETDNDREWIPGDGQTSAMGIGLPKDAGALWMKVLDDAEALLEGRLLAPHWRVEPTAGVNVSKLLQDPAPVDIVTWVQGHGLLPYMEQGPLVDDGNLRLFEQMFRGDALLFMVWLN